MTNAEKLWSVFDGFRDAYGVYNGISEERVDGKLLGTRRYTERKQSLRIELFEDHLNGVSGLGVIPIRSDNTVMWGAIDIDVYADLNHLALVKRLAALQVPIVTCRSKSGGAHLYCFCKEAVPASAMITKLKEVAAILGHGGVEIFPKQHTVLVEKGDLGSWINLPYFNGVFGMRYGVKPDGEAMELEEFFAAVESSRVDLAWFKKPLVVSTDLPQGPPCLQHLVQLGFPPGTRNQGLFSLGVYAKRSDPEGWESIIEEYNRKFMDPPLSSEEVMVVLKSLRKKDYQYRCSDQPIASHCNSDLCRTRKYGVGMTGSQLPSFGRITKLATDPPLWFWEVNGKRIELLTEELRDPRLFQLKCLERLNFMPPIPKQDVWAALLNEKLVDMDVVEAPAESSPEGQFWDYLEWFCTGRAPGETRDELLLGKTWTDTAEGRTYFRLNDLKKYLRQQQFKALTDSQITSAIKSGGGKWGQWVEKGKHIRWWSIPAQRVQTEPHEVPSKIAGEETPF